MKAISQLLLSSALLSLLLASASVNAQVVQFCTGDGCVAFSGDDEEGYYDEGYYNEGYYGSHHRHHGSGGHTRQGSSGGHSSGHKR